MDASYLRIKNWGKLQHYSDRRPPWIKLYQGLLGDDDDFARLDEATQWQLVRIWIVASRSASVTIDEQGNHVPVVANDAASLQRSIQSLKKIPLAKLIRDGWLIPVAEDELVAPEPRPDRRKRVASAALAAKDGVGSEDDARSERSSIVPNAPVDEQGEPLNDAASRPHVASNVLAERKHSASALYRGRETEGLELASLPGRHSEREGLPETINPENLLLVTRLMHRIGDHADDGTHHVVARYAAQLPPASIAKVVESLELHHPADRAAYAVGALRNELDERTAA